MAAHEAARRAGRHGPREGAARAVRGAEPVAGPRLRRGLAVAVGARGLVPVRGDRRPAARRDRGQGGHGARPADGPAGRGRRRLRQDRGRAPGRVQGDAGWQAGRGPRPDDGPRRPAPPHVQPAVRGLPARGPPPVPVRLGEGAGGHARRTHRRLGRRRDRDAPAAQQGRPVPRPRSGRGRRGAAVRRRGQGAPQADAPRSRRHDAVRDADPAHAQPGARRRPRPVAHRDAAGGSPAHPDARRRGDRGARPGRDPARARSRRPGVLRAQPGRDDRGAGRAAPPDAARRALRGRPRADGRGRARQGDARVRRRRGRRPCVHDDHRVGARHPEREHDHHRPRRHARAGPALPAARPRRAAARGAPTRTSCTAAANG